MPKFYITTPIYYVNDAPHIGSAYTTIAADVLARWHRGKGDKTFFLTGTDEHGAKIEAKATEAGLKPQEFVDQIAAEFKKTWLGLDISHDRFIRTTEEAHIKAVQMALRFMYDKGDIYAGNYEGLYCKACEQFKSERDLMGGKCPDHGTAPETMSEECYMFRLSKYQEKLFSLIDKDELAIAPKERKNEILSFYKNQGLSDIAFSRKKVKWGVKLPWDDSQTAYVWADAFLNYLTGLGWSSFVPLSGTSGDKDDASIGVSLPSAAPPKALGRAKEWWPPDVQLMSKDILRVHATIWPAMLLSLGLPLPKKIFVHGFFLVEGRKMSKSLGNVILPEEMIARYGVDATRYLLISVAPFGNDGDVSWTKFDEKYNADLANGLGNLVARVTNLIEKNEIQLDVKADIGEFGERFGALMNSLELEESLKFILNNLRGLDVELAEKKPWKEDNKEKIKNMLEPVAQKILSLSVLLRPFMPDAAEKIINQLSAEKIIKGEALFPRIIIKS